MLVEFEWFLKVTVQRIEAREIVVLAGDPDSLGDFFVVGEDLR